MSAATSASRFPIVSDLANLARRRFAGLLAAGVLAASGLTGCGHVEATVPVYPVTGHVTVGGKPAEGATVTLNPVGVPVLKSVAPKVTSKPDGTFAFSLYTAADGAPKGDYVVTVQWFKMVSDGGSSGAGPNVIPAKYTNPDTSPIKLTVKEGQNDLPIDIPAK